MGVTDCILCAHFDKIVKSHFNNPHSLLQKNLLVCSQRGPRGPQKQSSVVKKVGKPRDHRGMFYFKEGLNNSQ